MTYLIAWWLGFKDRLETESFGRTHDEDQDWNEAYDRGRNFAEWLLGVKDDDE